MEKVLINAQGKPGVFTVLAGRTPMSIEQVRGTLALAIPERFWEELDQYTSVDKYRLHTVPEKDLRDIKRVLKASGCVVRKVSPDKLPACWRNL